MLLTDKWNRNGAKAEQINVIRKSMVYNQMASTVGRSLDS